ncbi:IS66-like element accessory protein TnpA [Hyphococcus luteus]|nr:transposase [Marinicaulis flavus]
MAPRRRLRALSAAEKLKIVDEARRPGATMSAVARRHGIRGEELHAWRRAAREGRLTETDDAGAGPRFVPVVVTDASAGEGVEAAVGDVATAMIFSLPTGEKLSFDARVDPALLDRTLRVLRR